MSDLEWFLTTNLKFDKEIPDVFEYAFLHAGRLVLHVSDERKSIVLDNVLFIGSKETLLKRLDEPDGGPGHAPTRKSTTWSRVMAAGDPRPTSGGVGGAARAQHRAGRRSANPAAAASGR